MVVLEAAVATKVSSFRFFFFLGEEAKEETDEACSCSFVIEHGHLPKALIFLVLSLSPSISLLTLLCTVFFESSPREIM